MPTNKSGCVSVTTVIDYLKEPEIVDYMMRTSKAKREQVQKDAFAIGSIVDKLVQIDLGVKEELVVPFEYVLPVASCMTAWNKFKNDRPDIIGSIKEMQTELELDGIVGHPDIVCEDENRWGIIDVKTSKSIYPKYWTQTATYSSMIKNQKPRFIGVLRLDKISENYFYQEITQEEVIQYEVSVFQAYLTAYKHAFKIREVLRSQLEEELLCSTK